MLWFQEGEASHVDIICTFLCSSNWIICPFVYFELLKLFFFSPFLLWASECVILSINSKFFYFLLQGMVYLIFTVGALFNWMAFIVTKHHSFLYLAVAFTISIGTYLGFFRTQIKKKQLILGWAPFFPCNCVWCLTKC